MSLWNNIEIENVTGALKENREVDILIIGAGITGITTAYYLKDKSICVVDANKIGHGVTRNTTAKINYFQERYYTKIKELTNEETARLYLQSQREAITDLLEIIKVENIECDLKKVPSYVFSTLEKEKKFLKKEYEFLRNNHIEIKEEKVPLDFPITTSYKVEDTYIFHPLKYIKGLVEVLREDHIPIYENTKITKVIKNNNEYICYSDKYFIRAKTVIFACHYPYFFKSFFLPIKSYIGKSYIVVSKTEKKEDFTAITSSNPTYSIRFYEEDNQKYQLSLSESHNTAVAQNDEEHFENIKEIFKIKENDIVDTYSNVDIMTPDLLPYIGKIKENMYISTGYNTWGMTNSIVGAKMLLDLIEKGENQYEKIFDPLRKNRSYFLKMPYHILMQAKSFLGAKIHKNKDWYDHVYFKTINGNNIGIYIDHLGKRHMVYNKCPHVGCSLIFNEAEKTWDCPCHSSRFDMDGKCIKGPSQKDISYIEENDK